MSYMSSTTMTVTSASMISDDPPYNLVFVFECLRAIQGQGRGWCSVRVGVSACVYRSFRFFCWCKFVCVLCACALCVC